MIRVPAASRVLLWGDDDDPPLARVARVLARRGAETLRIDSRTDIEYVLELGPYPKGHLIVAEQEIPVTSLCGIYLRPTAASSPARRAAGVALSVLAGGLTIPVVNRPLITHLIANLKRHGVDHVVLAASASDKRIEEALGDGAGLGVRLSYSYETEPLGSGLAVKGSHLRDPRTGGTAARATRVWALADSAAVSDALSTAFFVMSDTEIAAFCAAHPEAGAAITMPGDSLALHGSLRSAPLAPNAV